MSPKNLVVAPAALGSGGLGTAAAEFTSGLESLGHEVLYVGMQPSTRLIRATSSRPFRRFFTMSSCRRLTARAVRNAVPSGGWDLAYSTPGTVPIGNGDGLNVICQATRHPAVEWRALRNGERETGGRGDMSRGELRRREYELERADLVHATSLAVRKELLESGIPEERIVHSYHGVELDRFAPGPKPDRLKLVFVGPLSLRKGVDIVAQLRSRLSEDAILEAIGGPTDPWSRRISEKARFAHGSDVPAALASSHVLVLPSRSDGFSFVVLEALASGTIPIVTPEVGASEIVLRLDKRLVIPRDEFVDSTVELLPNLDLPDLSRRARALAEEFDRQKTSTATATAVLERAEQLASR